MVFRRMTTVAALIAALWAPAATAAPFDVYYRAGDAANWIFYGGRETRAAADATASELARSSGFETKVMALGEPEPRPAIGPAVRESIAVGGGTYVRRPGLGYSAGWYRHGGGWGAGIGGFGWGGGWGGGAGGGWGGGYGGYGGSSSHHHHSSHHHSHEHHSSSHHHSGTHSTAHPSASSHGASRGGRSSSSHHSHSHSHSHAHHSHSHSHGGHRK